MALLRKRCFGAIAVTIPGLIVIVVIHQASYTDRSILTPHSIDIVNQCTRFNLEQPTNSPTLSGLDIPSVVHQIWKTADVSTYPTKASHKSWKATAESMNYTVKLWTDDDILKLINEKYSWLLSTYEGYSQHIQRADVARLVVVHAEGGIYADLDVHPRSVESMSCLQHLGRDGIFAPTAGNSRLSNHFFLAPRESSFLWWALEEAKRRGGSKSKRILLPYLRVFWSTGPLMITSAYRQYIWMFGSYNGPVLLDQHYTRTVVGHAAGRSWHGPDGHLLNYMADNMRLDGLLIVLSFLIAVLGFGLAWRQFRARRRRFAASFEAINGIRQPDRRID